MVFFKLCYFFTFVLAAHGSIIYTAQCRSRCHIWYKRNQTDLSRCLTACVDDPTILGKCIVFCKKDRPNTAPCHHSCKFIKKLHFVDYLPGKCSLKKHSSIEYCDKNIKCDELKKCCYTYCEEIVVHGEEVKVNVSEVTSSSLVARWKQSNIRGAVYILQLRMLQSTTIYYTEDEWSDWQQIRQEADMTGVKLSGISSGARLQLRVAVVNSSGLQSIGPPTCVIRTLFNASKPSAPEQVWLFSKTYRKESVSVTIIWSPPAILDVPVHRYRIFWKEIPHLKTGHIIFTKKHTSVEGTQHNYTIEGLKTNKTYCVEVQAICQWRTKRLKGSKAAINVSTGHMKDAGQGTKVYLMNTTGMKKTNSSTFHDEPIKDLEVLHEAEHDNNNAVATRKPTKRPVRSSVAMRESTFWLNVVLVFIFCKFWTN